MSPREVRGPCWSVPGYGLYECLFDVRKTGQPLVCMVSGQGDRVYPMPQVQSRPARQVELLSSLTARREGGEPSTGAKIFIDKSQGSQEPR